ncbi:MAG TPA: fibronectin type III domain-containing protein [bacterium]|nr:fibronectin type III domain-containing protein [bacterium]
MIGLILYVEACRFGGGDDEGPGVGVGGHLIPGLGEPGYDLALEDKMDRYFAAYKTFASAPFGMSLDGYVGNTTDRELIERFVNENPDGLDWDLFCAQDPDCPAGYGPYRVIDGATIVRDGVIKRWDEWGDLGMFGGVAAAGEFYRYAVLKDQGYPDALVTEARDRCLLILEALHIAHTIHGYPGYIVRGLKPKNIAPDEVLHGFTVGGEPYPEKKGNTMRDDVTGLYPEWSWMDSASGDQFDGWLLLMGVAWDVVRDDPDVPQYLKDQMVEDARETGDMLMAVSPESGTDMLIRDADGRLVQFCNVHPNVVSYGEGCPGFAVMDQPTISFEAIMGLGFIRVLYHITGDEKLRAYYYDELIERRRWHEFILESPWTMADMGYATNFSNVNMVFVAYYNAIRYESDPAVRLNLQMSLETVLWDNGNIRQPREMQQPWYDFIYASLRYGGNPAAEVAGGIQTLEQWPEPPNFNDPVINCDPDEIAQGWCLAINGVDVIELAPPEFRQAGDLVAEQVVPRRVRPHSNFDWRSNPYSVNGGGNGRQLNPNGEMLAAYWMGRYMRTGTSPVRNISPIAQVPQAPGTPAGLAAVAVSEAQVNLAWNDPDHLEAEFIIERRTDPGAFIVIAAPAMDQASFSDLGLTPATAYEYRVRGRNVVGDSAYSDPATAVTFPAPAAAPLGPSNLAATALDHQSIQLTWDDESADEMGFKIYREPYGVIFTTLANVTTYTDTGLTDDTAYQYMVTAYNSHGGSWPSNIAAATTDKLPSIFAVSPLANEFQVNIAIGRIKAGFGDPVLPTDVQFDLFDEVGTVDGSWTLDGTGTELTFVPDPLLLTMSTEYTAKVTLGAFVYQYKFNTDGPNWTVNIDDSVDKAFAMSVFDSEVVEPESLRDLLGALGLDFYLILGVLEADSVNNELRIIGALGNASAPDPSVQDMSQPTILFGKPANTDANPAWELGPADLPLLIEGYPLIIRQVYLSGIFEKDYNYSGKGEMRGGLDLRPLAVIIGLQPADLCLTLMGACSECPGDPGRIECVNLYLRNMRAELNADPVVPVAQAAPKDLGGTSASHTIELTLIHPATGDPEPGVAIRVVLNSGNGAVDGAAEALVTTGPDGKATVTVTDPDGGTDEIEASIDSPVGYLWVNAKLNVAF